MSLSEQNRAIPTPDNFRLFGFATGSYMCHCHTCKVEFEGDKRAITCLPCALTRAETAVRQDGSAGDAGAAMRHTLSVQATDKSDRAEGVAALQQAGWRPMADAHKNGEPILALTISQFPGRPDLDHWRNKQIVVHHRGLAPDGFDIGWSMNAPVGHGGFPDDWFVGWAPLPQQTALVEEGVEKIIAPHEPAACGEGTLPSPSEPPRSAGGEAR